MVNPGIVETVALVVDDETLASVNTAHAPQQARITELEGFSVR